MEARAVSVTVAVLLASVARAQKPVYSTYGERAGDAAGSALAVLGDLDGDGVPDFVVGAPRSDGGGSNAGRAWIVSGADGSLVLFVDGVAGENLGAAAAALGDLNGDGRTDFALGAPFHAGGAPSTGRVLVVSGVDGSVLRAHHGNEQFGAFGTRVASAGDVDGDGVGDLLVGAPNEDSNGADAGNAYVFSGASGSPLAGYYGDGAGDLLGDALAGDLDLDLDGFADFAVGSPRSDVAGTDAGLVRLYSGPTGAFVRMLVGDSPGDRFGSALARVADVDADGRDEVLVGAPRDDDFGPDCGSARLYSGKDGSVLFTVFGSAGDQLGATVAGVGDVDGDGTADVLVGAPFADVNGNDSGYVLVVSGRDGSVIARVEGAAGDRLGASLSALGDLDGGGREEVLVGAPGVDHRFADGGRVRAYGDAAPATIESCSATASSLGVACRLTISGTQSVRSDDLVLAASPVPAGTFGLFFFGPGRTRAPLGDGYLCVDPAGLGFLVRLPGVAADATGRLERALDLRHPPTALAIVAPGSSWTFQAWFRDLAAGGTGFNFSTAVTVPFVP